MLEHRELKMPFELGPVSFLEDDREVKQGIRRNFARRAASYDRHAEMQRLMAASLVVVVGERLAQARRILEIGCGTGYLTSLLRQANRAARRRLGPGAGVSWLVADGEAPIRGSYDLIIANATFQWFTHPEETLAAGLDHLLVQDLRPLFPGLPTGAVVIQGQADRIVDPAQGEFLTGHLAGARLNLLPGAGHLPFLTQAAAFNGILEQCLSTAR